VQVPLFAIIPGEAGHAAFVVEPAVDAPVAPGAVAGTGWVARRRAVKLGVVQGHMVEITAGLKPGEKLIVLGQRAVADGGAVTIVRTVRDLAELAR
jgi:hypothetical protein